MPEAACHFTREKELHDGQRTRRPIMMLATRTRCSQYLHFQGTDFNVECQLG